MESNEGLRAIEWREEGLYLLDQRQLPRQTVYLPISSAAAAAQAIKEMAVRGAPAIGITAAYGAALAAKAAYQQFGATWREHIETDLQLLAEARPTAVNLSWALAQMRCLFPELSGDPFPRLLEQAKQIHAADLQDNQKMAELGAALIQPGSGVLTHCNAGALATGGYGTALGVIRSAYREGKISQVYAGETRPWLQGSRLTAWELLRDHIPVILLTDNAAASLMAREQIDWVIVGADRIAANGDTANKIGTYSLAVQAYYHGVKVMVVAPTSTFDLNLPNGQAIPIEERGAAEVLSFAGQQIAPAEAQAWNPVFDVTPASLIDVIVTEKGIIESPFFEGIAQVMTK